MRVRGINNNVNNVYIINESIFVFGRISTTNNTKITNAMINIYRNSL